MRRNDAKMLEHVAKPGGRPPDHREFGLLVKDGFVAAVSGQPGPEPFVVPLGPLCGTRPMTRRFLGLTQVDGRRPRGRSSCRLANARGPAQPADCSATCGAPQW